MVNGTGWTDGQVTLAARRQGRAGVRSSSSFDISARPASSWSARPVGVSRGYPGDATRDAERRWWKAHASGRGRRPGGGTDRHPRGARGPTVAPGVARNSPGPAFRLSRRGLIAFRAACYVSLQHLQRFLRKCWRMSQHAQEQARRVSLSAFVDRSNARRWPSSPSARTDPSRPSCARRLRGTSTAPSRTRRTDDAVAA